MHALTLLGGVSTDEFWGSCRKGPGGLSRLACTLVAAAVIHQAVEQAAPVHALFGFSFVDTVVVSAYYR